MASSRVISSSFASDLSAAILHISARTEWYRFSSKGRPIFCLPTGVPGMTSTIPSIVAWWLTCGIAVTARLVPSGNATFVVDALPEEIALPAGHAVHGDERECHTL